MKNRSFCIRVGYLILTIILICLVAGCGKPVTQTPIAQPLAYMAMNPPPDSDKPFPVQITDLSCWLHTAANMLAAAGYGDGTSVQERADDIYKDMETHYGSNTSGWIDTALQWWLASANNTWTSNPYTVVTVYGNKTKIPWANSNGAMDIGNYLRDGQMVGVSISWVKNNVGSGGHAITAWGDELASINPLTGNPKQIVVTDSDRDDGGDVQTYDYDDYSNPNPGGGNLGSGWYFNYDANHPFIKHITTLCPTSGANGVNTVHVLGSYQIQQDQKIDATDLHYTVSTDTEILSYSTWIDWPGTPKITESNPRTELTVDWIFDKPVPYGQTVTITTEFILTRWNKIVYNDVYFTYLEKEGSKLPDLAWEIDTPDLKEADYIPNVTGGYVIGSFEVYDPANPDKGVVQYRLVHEYLYDQTPELHTFLLNGSRGLEISNIMFGHSYGYPSVEELWEFKDWMTMTDKSYQLNGDTPVEITIDWTGRLPYPEGDLGE